MPWDANIQRRSPRSPNASLCSCRWRRHDGYRRRVGDRRRASCCPAAARMSRPSITARKRRSTPNALDPLRDAVTLPLIRAAVERKTPLFAICRGFQEFNVALGGSLHQAVHAVDGHKDHRAPTAKMFRSTRLTALFIRSSCAAGCATGSGATRSWSIRCMGRESLRLAKGLKPEAFAEDGLIEAARGPDEAAFCLGVQWHPDCGEGERGVQSIVPPLRRGGERHQTMTAAQLTGDEAQAFLDANPKVQWIDAFPVRYEWRSARQAYSPG